MGPDDVFPALASFAFDMCMPGTLLGTGDGRTGGGGSEGTWRRTAKSLLTVLRQSGATVVHATPTTWSLLLEAGFSRQGTEAGHRGRSPAARVCAHACWRLTIRCTTSTVRRKPRSGRRSVTSVHPTSRWYWAARSGQHPDLHSRQGPAAGARRSAGRDSYWR